MVWWVQMSKDEQWLLDEKYGGMQSSAFVRDCARLAKGEPLSYVIGSASFLSASIDLSLRPFIPRPETEYWVGEAIATLARERGSRARLRFLDTCAGSGCIGLALLQRFPKSSVDFIDTDPRCLKQIAINLERNGIDVSRARIGEGDLLACAQGTYDYIFSNPPYIACETAEARVERSVLAHEPHSALFASERGLVLIFRLLREASAHLKPGGALFVEFDDIQKEEIERFIKKETDLKVRFFHDQYKKWRWLEGVSTDLSTLA